MSSRRSVPRPKRSGEEFTRTHHQNNPDSPSASKKLRFDVRNPSALAPDAAEEDAMLDADEIGKRGQQAKRNAVNIDGFDSDSSNEAFDARADAKAKSNGNSANGAGANSMAEEENDMFADIEEQLEGGEGDEDEDFSVKGKKRKKAVSFLEDDDIEGQNLNSTSGGHVSADFSIGGEPNGTHKGKGRAATHDKEDESSSDSDVGDEARAAVGDADEEVGAGGKKEHAPRLDAFNMRNEQEEGRFDNQGNFVRKATDADAVHDSWLEGISKKEMKRAKEASDKRNDELRLQRIENDKVLTSDILKSLIPQLERGETVLEALARLGKGKPKNKPKRQKNRRKDSNDMDVDQEKATEDPAESHRKATIEAITSAADQLLTRGQAEIYDAERELLTRQYARETGEPWQDLPDREEGDEKNDNALNEPNRRWEYKWTDARDGGEVHGPYEEAMMKAWLEAGYFGEGIEYRESGREEWSKTADFA